MPAAGIEAIWSLAAFCWCGWHAANNAIITPTAPPESHCRLLSRFIGPLLRVLPNLARRP